MILDLGCFLEVQSLHVVNTHNSAFNSFTTKNVCVSLQKWNNKNKETVLFEQDIDSAIDQVISF